MSPLFTKFNFRIRKTHLIPYLILVIGSLIYFELFFFQKYRDLEQKMIQVEEKFASEPREKLVVIQEERAVYEDINSKMWLFGATQLLITLIHIGFFVVLLNKDEWNFQLRSGNRALSERLNLIIQKKVSLFFLLDGSGKIQSTNTASREFGMEKGASRIFELSFIRDLPRSKKKLQALLDRVKAGEREISDSIHLENKEGELVFCNVTIVDLGESKGKNQELMVEFMPNDSLAKRQLTARIKEKLEELTAKNASPEEILTRAAEISLDVHSFSCVELWRRAENSEAPVRINCFGTKSDGGLPPPESWQQILENRTEDIFQVQKNDLPAPLTLSYREYGFIGVQAFGTSGEGAYFLVYLGQDSPGVNWDFDFIREIPDTIQSAFQLSTFGYQQKQNLLRFNQAEKLGKQASFSINMRSGLVSSSQNASFLFPELEGEENPPLPLLNATLLASSPRKSLETWTKEIDREGSDRMEISLEAQSEESRFFLLQLRRLDETDEGNQWLLTVRDISLEKELEATKDELLEKLTRSNQELQQFAYVASHDLQEPLRKIRAFGDLLSSEYKDTPDFAGQQYIDRMSSSAARMQTLINDLLAYSRISRDLGEVREISLSKLISDILEDLELSIEESGAEINMGELPTIEGKPVQLRQLFQNIISNSIKFSKEDQQPEISIQILEEMPEHAFSGLPLHFVRDEYFCISIRDNGIGFEMKYVEKVFSMFQRLHGINQYKGSGIGLAVSRRCIENHGGNISAWSEIGEGAEFFLFFPKSILQKK